MVLPGRFELPFAAPENLQEPKLLLYFKVYDYKVTRESIKLLNFI